MIDLPLAYLNEWKNQHPYYIEEKAQKREEYPWDYLGDYRITITGSNSSNISATSSSIGIPFISSFS